MSDFAVVVESALRIERLLPGPIERVWAYLTESEKRGQWLAAGEIELRVGGGVDLHFRNAELSTAYAPAPERYKEYENGGTLSGSVTACEPPRLLSYTWNEGSAPDAVSEVTFELTPRGGDVLLVVSHRRLADRTTMISAAGGWHTHLDVLVDRLNGREPGPFWPRNTELEAEYEQRL